MAATDGTDGPPGKKAKFDDSVLSKTSNTGTKAISLPLCPYGERCYRKNPAHFKEYSHPSKDEKKDNTTNTVPIDTTKLPPCPYGAKCYRKNLLHFAEFSHPFTSGGSGDGGGSDDDDDEDVVPEDDSGSDTDVYEWEEDEKEKENGEKTKDNKCDVTLTKSYSKMSDAERRELIQKAMEAKQHLEKQLEETKKQVEEKAKQLEQMHEQVTEGVLLMEGEKDALAGIDIKYYDLIPERTFKEGSAAQAHFRLAESQFYRLLGGAAYSNYKVTKVQYIVNPNLHSHFKKAKDKLKASRGEQYSYPVLAFHGTQMKNIKSIVEGGFKVPGDDGFQHRTDSGYYGRGVYFSEYPGYSMGYIQGCNKILLCQVLLGKVYQCDTLIQGKPLKSGYDSHTSPNKKELIIFDADHILPCYIVQYFNTLREFKYQVDSTKIKTGDALRKLYWKAARARKSSVFAGYIFGFSGQLCDTHSKLKKLVKKHGENDYKGPACIGSPANGYFTTLVCTQTCVDNNEPKVAAATGHNLSIVSEQYIYDTIIAGTQQDISDYYMT